MVGFMRKFLLRLFLFAVIFIVGCFCLLNIPANPKFKATNLFAFSRKNESLISTPAPRIVFLGGSNTSFGINSQIIKDSLFINPVNNGIHAGIGLNYMLENYLKYAKPGDIVVLIPEYQQYCGDMAGGNVNLLSLLIDVVKEKTFSDYLHIIQLRDFIPEYIFSKLKFWTFFEKPVPSQKDIVGVGSFNEYGDAVVHWDMPKPEKIEPYSITDSLNPEVFLHLKEFRKELETRKIQLFVSFPCYQDSSFDRNTTQIHSIGSELKNTGISILGSPERYRMDSKLVFNTPYHLTKEGLDLRTRLIVQDLKSKQYGMLNKFPNR